MKRLLLAAALLALCAVASAADFTVTYSPVLKDTNGADITETIYYKVYDTTNAGTRVMLAQSTNLTQTFANRPDEYTCFVITAKGPTLGESNSSPEICLDFSQPMPLPNPKPLAPTGVSITRTK